MESLIKSLPYRLDDGERMNEGDREKQNCWDVKANFTGR
jgi:hypothetical protein